MNFQGDWYLKSDSLLRRMGLYNGLYVQSLVVFFELSSLGLSSRFAEIGTLVEDQLL